MAGRGLQSQGHMGLRPDGRAPSVPVLDCEEGCGCRFERAKAFVISIDGVDRFFCCSDCAEKFENVLLTKAASAVREHVPKGSTVADIGCGTGYYTRLMLSTVGKNGRVYAADADPAVVERARRALKASRRSRRLVLRVAPAEDLRFVPDASLSFLLSNNVICCMDDRDAAVREIRRTLKPSGVAYVRISLMEVEGVRPMTVEEWGTLLSRFTVRDRGSKGDVRWALVSPHARS